MPPTATAARIIETSCPPHVGVRAAPYPSAPSTPAEPPLTRLLLSTAIILSPVAALAKDYAVEDWRAQ